MKRGPAKYKQQPTVLVILEDEQSSKIYFEEASRYYRAHTRVKCLHVGHTDPKGIVTEGIKESRHYDHVYCVIDRDSHETFDAAVSMARNANPEKFTLLTSYPCFEFWLLLHFNYTRSPFVRTGPNSPGDMVKNALKKYPDMENYEKSRSSFNGLFQRLLSRLPYASRNAQRTLEEATSEGEKNPSTPLHQLIKELEKLGEPVPL